MNDIFACSMAKSSIGFKASDIDIFACSMAKSSVSLKKSDTGLLVNNKDRKNDTASTSKEVA